MRIPASSPSLTLSTSGASVLTVASLPSAALASGADGLDVDLARGSLRLRLASLMTKAAAAGTGIRSIWLPPPRTSPRNGCWSGACSDQAWLRNHTGSVDLVIIDRAERGPIGTVPLDGVSIRSMAPATTQIAISLRSSDLEGTRDHLIALAMLRRYAEEWDFQVALDLSGRVDPAWEVEAALIRLFPRLTLVRLRLPIGRDASYHQHRTTARAVATLTDLRFRGTVAVAPVLPVWQRWWPPAVANASREAIEGLRERFAPVQHPLTLEPFRERPNLL